MCVMCLKYRVIILIIIVISLGQILLSYKPYIKHMTHSVVIITHYNKRTGYIIIAVLTCFFFAGLSQSVAAVTMVVTVQVVAVPTGR